MKWASLVGYILLGLNQYRLTVIIQKNSILMEELSQNLMEQQYRSSVLQKKCDILESSFQNAKVDETSFTFLQDYDVLSLILGVCGTLALIYIGTQCAPLIIRGTGEFCTNINDITKNIGKATIDAIDRIDRGLERFEKISVVDRHGTVMTFKPVLGNSLSDVGCTGLYIKPVNSSQEIFIGDINDLYVSYSEMLERTMPKFTQSEILSRFGSVDFSF